MVKTPAFPFPQKRKAWPGTILSFPVLITSCSTLGSTPCECVCVSRSVTSNLCIVQMGCCPVYESLNRTNQIFKFTLLIFFLTRLSFLIINGDRLGVYLIKMLQKQSDDLNKYLPQDQTHSKYLVYIRCYNFKYQFNATVPNEVLSLNLGHLFSDCNRNNRER